MIKLYRFLVKALDSWFSAAFVVAYSLASFCFGQFCKDMNLFAASGAIMTVFGLFSMIRFTTIEKYLNQESIVTTSTGVTSPPLNPEQAAKAKERNQQKVKLRLTQELRSELKGILFTVIGTIIWAYGAYIPIYQRLSSQYITSAMAGVGA
jgi:hypothetical protein